MATHLEYLLEMVTKFCKLQKPLKIVYPGAIILILPNFLSQISTVDFVKFFAKKYTQVQDSIVITVCRSRINAGVLARPIKALLVDMHD